MTRRARLDATLTTRNEGEDLSLAVSLPGLSTTCRRRGRARVQTARRDRTLTRPTGATRRIYFSLSSGNALSPGERDRHREPSAGGRPACIMRELIRREIREAGIEVRGKDQSTGGHKTRARQYFIRTRLIIPRGAAARARVGTRPLAAERVLSRDYIIIAGNNTNCNSIRLNACDVASRGFAIIVITLPCTVKCVLCVNTGGAGGDAYRR